MVNKRQFSKELSVHRVLMALKVLADQQHIVPEVAAALSDEGLATIRTELGRIAKALSSDADVPDGQRIGALVSDWLKDSEPMGLPAITGPVYDGTERVSRPEWEKHEDKKRSAKDIKRETRWTAKWNGFRLLIKRRYDPIAKVIFEGFVDDFETPIASDKMKSRVEGLIEAQALRRLKDRPKK